MNMKRISILGAAVAAVLGTGPAFALDPAVTNDSNAQVKLTISGSSAFESAFESELSGASSSICISGSYNKFVASVTTGTAPDLRAYTCNSIASLFGVSKTVLITYRGEGGSVYGLPPVIRAGSASNKVLRLVVNPACAFNSLGSTAANNCLVGTSYTPATDALVGQTASAADANSDYGVMDEEPNQFKTPNYPDTATAAKLQPALTDAERSAANTASAALVLQSFGVYTHVQTTSPTAQDTEYNNLGRLRRHVERLGDRAEE